jgi:hypothetical protein
MTSKRQKTKQEKQNEWWCVPPLFFLYSEYLSTIEKITSRRVCRVWYRLLKQDQAWKTLILDRLTVQNQNAIWKWCASQPKEMWTRLKRIVLHVYNYDYSQLKIPVPKFLCLIPQDHVKLEELDIQLTENAKNQSDEGQRDGLVFDIEADLWKGLRDRKIQHLKKLLIRNQSFSFTKWFGLFDKDTGPISLVTPRKRYSYDVLFSRYDYNTSNVSIQNLTELATDPDFLLSSQYYASTVRLDNLRSLTISWADYGVGEPPLNKLMKTFSISVFVNLTRLVVDGISMTDEGLSTITRHTPNLKDLTCWSFVHHGQGLLSAVTNLAHLETLDVEWKVDTVKSSWTAVPKVDGDELVKLLTHLKRLTWKGIPLPEVDLKDCESQLEFLELALSPAAFQQALKTHLFDFLSNTKNTANLVHLSLHVDFQTREQQNASTKREEETQPQQRELSQEVLRAFSKFYSQRMRTLNRLSHLTLDAHFLRCDYKCLVVNNNTFSARVTRKLQVLDVINVWNAAERNQWLYQACSEWKTIHCVGLHYQTLPQPVLFSDPVSSYVYNDDE